MRESQNSSSLTPLPPEMSVPRPFTLTRLNTPQHQLVAEFNIPEPTILEDLQRGDPKVLGYDFRDSAIIFQTSEEGYIKIDPDGNMIQAIQGADGKWQIEHIGKYLPHIAAEKTTVTLGEELVLPVEPPQSIPQKIAFLFGPRAQVHSEDQAFGTIERILVVSQGTSGEGKITDIDTLPQDLPVDFFVPYHADLARGHLQQQPLPKAA